MKQAGLVVSLGERCASRGAEIFRLSKVEDMKPAKIQISVVTMRVNFQPMDSGLDEEEAMLQVFAFTTALKLREDSRAHYQAGNYDQLQGKSGASWMGMIELQREGRASRTIKDSKRGYLLQDSGSTILTSEDSTIFAYSPITHVVAVRERASIPFTRLASYVLEASRLYSIKDPKRRFYLSLSPIRSEKTLADWIEYFTEIRSVQTEFRHSQSPGNRMVDRLLEQTNADKARSSVRAKPGESLNKDKLLDTGHSLGQQLNHLDVNPDNGTATLEGKVGNDVLKVNTHSEVARLRIESDVNPDLMGVELASIARHVPEAPSEKLQKT